MNAHRNFPGSRLRGWRLALMITLGSALLVLLLLEISSILMVNGMFTHRVEKFHHIPEDLDLSASTVSFTSSDGIPLQAWWVPAEPSRGIVVLLHGMDGMDASTLLPHAVFLKDAGYSSLVLDMRAHGRSGGDRIGLAFEEPRDVNAALDWIASQPELHDQPVALFGISMGGATAIRAASERPDVDAVISVSAFASIDRMLSAGMRSMGMPDPLVGAYEPFVRLAIWVVYNAGPTSQSPLADMPRTATRPVLLIHGTADSQVDVTNAELLIQAAQGRAEAWIVSGADHCVYTGDGTGPEDALYRQKVLEFLGRVESFASWTSK